MAVESSMKELAEKLEIGVDRLVEYFKQAKIAKKSGDAVSNKEQVDLALALRGDVAKKETGTDESKKSVLKLGARKRVAATESVAGKTRSVEVKRVRTRTVGNKAALSTDIFSNLKLEIVKKESELTRIEELKKEKQQKEKEEKALLASDI